MTEKPQWFDRRMSIGNLISIVVLVGGMAGSWYNLKQNQAVQVLALERVQALQAQELVGLRVQLSDNRVRIEKVETARDDMRERLIRLEIGQSQQNDILREVLSVVKAARQ